MKDLQSRGYEILVAAPPDEYSDKLVALGFRFIPLKKLKSKSYNPLADYFLYKEFYGILKEHRPSMVFNYTIKPNIYGVYAASRLKIPAFAVVTGLGYVFTHKNLISLAAQQLYKIILNRASEIWFLNADDQQTFIESKIVPAEKTFLLPGEGIDTDQFNATTNTETDGDRPTRFILVARMIFDKGIKEFVEASRILKAKGYKFESSLLGFMDVINPKAISRQQMDEWTAEGVISYLGVTDNVSQFIEQTDCVVLPSYYSEGIPRTLMEGASMKKVVITTNNVGCKEVVDDGITGFLCNKKDAADLAEKMEQVIKLTPGKRKEMGEKGREKMINFFDERIIKEIYLKKIRAILPF
jgi:glycosyltransferase involved in cell wall biosynthesis